MGLATADPERSPSQPLVPATALEAWRVPPLGHAEAASIATIELERFLALLRQLSPNDWIMSTACTLWDVRQVVAHVVGAAASYARWSEFARQWTPWVQRAHRQPGFSILDAINQIQVEDRADAFPADLIEELQAVGPRAIRTRQRLPRWIRGTRLPMPALGVAPIGYLTDLIYARDMWIHRLDISRATCRAMALDASHDGRIVSLMVRDLGQTAGRFLGPRSIVLDLRGEAGGAFILGDGAVPWASLGFDAMDFAWLAAGRMTPEEARDAAVLRGDHGLAGDLLERISVPV